MPIWVDHLLFLTLAVVLPLRAGLFGYRRLLRASAEELPRRRLRLYRQAMLFQWALSAGVVALWAWRRRPWAALGVVPRPTGTLILAAAALVVSALFMLLSLRRATTDERALEQVRGKMRHLERMLPHTSYEHRWFVRLALTAGICEELLYRGYLIWYLAAFLGPGFWQQAAAVTGAAVCFGFGHVYQGGKGVAVTGSLGVLLGAGYLYTGSLYAPMALHALVDLYSGRLTFEALRRAPVPAPQADEVPVAPAAPPAAGAAAESFPAANDARAAEAAPALPPDESRDPQRPDQSRDPRPPDGSRDPQSDPS